MGGMGGGGFGSSRRGLTITIPTGSVARYIDDDGVPVVEIDEFGTIRRKGDIGKLRPRP